MANIDINKGNIYTFAKINDETVITGATDNAATPFLIRNNLIVGYPGSGNNPDTKAHSITLKTTTGRLTVDQQDGGVTSPVLWGTNENTDADATCHITLQRYTSLWSFGVGHNSFSNDFVIANTNRINSTNFDRFRLSTAGALTLDGPLTTNSGTTLLGNVSAGTNTVQIGKSGGSGAGLNILNMYAENDSSDGQTCNEIRMYGHEGRGQGIRIADTDYDDKIWWMGCPYQGNQGYLTFGFDDATGYYPRGRAAIMYIVSPDVVSNGSVRFQDWDNNTNSGFSSEYMWQQHNGTDARLGTNTGHFDYHTGGDESGGTHRIRFDSDGGFHVYSMATYSSGGSSVKWHGGELKRSSSTRKIKKEIKSIESDNSAITNFNKLRPVEYKQKLDNLVTYGFIAEEIAEVDSKLAVWDKDYTRDEKGQLVDSGERDDTNKEIHKLDSDKIVPADLEDRAILALAVAKIQQLEKRIKELENK